MQIRTAKAINGEFRDRMRITRIVSMNNLQFYSSAWVMPAICFVIIGLGASKIVNAKTVTHALVPMTSSQCPWLNQSLSVGHRLRLLFRQLTLQDKIALVHGIEPSHGYGGFIRGIPRLCVPALTTNGGPGGVAHQRNVTALPAPVAGFATWNSKLMYEYGKVMGEEAKAKGIDVIFGPMINILRDPRWGRAWETCGEDRAATQNPPSVAT